MTSPRLRLTRIAGVAVVLVAAVSLGARPCLAGVGLEAYLNETALRELCMATSTDALDRSYAKLPYRDAVVEMIYQAKRSTLMSGAGSDKALLRTIPKNPLEFWAFYAVTYTESYKSCPPLAEVVSGYFERLARAVARRKEGIRDFLLLSRFADGEVAGQLADWNEFLQTADPEAFASAVRSLDPESRRRVCGDCAGIGQGVTPCVP